MKQILIAVGLAGAIIGGVIGLAGPANALDVDDVTDACKGYVVSEDWRAGFACRSVAQTYLDNLNWALNGGASYIEECLGEGCSGEEVGELHRDYREEMIRESGGKFHEAMELAVGIWQRVTNGQQEGAFVLAMLADFDKRGWSVRMKDRNDALNRANGY